MAKTTDLDAVIASVPSNSTAARVMGKGVHYEPAITLPAHYVHNDLPPAMLPPLKNPPHTYTEIFGRTFGRLRALGLSAEQNRKKGARWVVRCSCGRYENRKAKALKAAHPDTLCCVECQHLRRIKERYRSLGGKAPEEFDKSKS